MPSTPSREADAEGRDPRRLLDELEQRPGRVEAQPGGDEQDERHGGDGGGDDACRARRPARHRGEGERRRGAGRGWRRSSIDPIPMTRRASADGEADDDDGVVVMGEAGLQAPGRDRRRGRSGGRCLPAAVDHRTRRAGCRGRRRRWRGRRWRGRRRRPPGRSPAARMAAAARAGGGGEARRRVDHPVVEGGEGPGEREHGPVDEQRWRGAGSPSQSASPAAGAALAERRAVRARRRSRRRDRGRRAASEATSSHACDAGSGPPRRRRAAIPGRGANPEPGHRSGEGHEPEGAIVARSLRAAGAAEAAGSAHARTAPAPRRPRHAPRRCEELQKRAA